MEHRQRPALVDTSRPRLSWTDDPLSPSLAGLAQSAYRIVAASDSQRLADGRYDVWDSGRVPSAQSHLVPYAGVPLKDGADYWWRVMVWDEQGEPSAWSEPSTWGMAPSQASLRGQWIGAPWRDERSRRQRQETGMPADTPAPLLRRSFIVRAPVKKARLYACPLGWGEMWLNGQRVGTDQLSPAQTDYTCRPDLDHYPLVIDNEFTGHRVMYTAHDVTSMIREGRNALGAILGNGFYDPLSHWDAPYGSPRLWCMLTMEYADGTADTVATDGLWRAAPSAILADGPFTGEVYDARLEHPGWSKPAYDDCSWQQAVQRLPPLGRLTPQTVEADAVTATYRPTRLEPRPDGSVEVYFPEEISGWVRLHGLPTREGQQIELVYRSESPLGVALYTARDGLTDYRPRFTWYVFSQVNIKGAPGLTADMVTAEAVNTPMPQTGQFATTLPLIDSIEHIWRRAVADNAHGGILSDCPHRERTAYTGDAQVTVDKVLAAFDAAPLYIKWLADMRLAQNPRTGYVPNSAPWQPGAGGGVAWGAAMSLMPWSVYTATGDTAVLRDNYGAMQAQARYMDGWLTERGTMLARRANAGDSLGREVYWLNLGDWCAPGDSLCSREAAHTFYMWRSWHTVALAARVLGLRDEAARAESRAQETREAYHRAFYNEATNSYGPNGADVFALVMDAPPDSLRPLVEASLVDECRRHGAHIFTGMYAGRHLGEVLADAGEADLAIALLTRRSYPSFGHMLAQGAKATWEQWNGENSHNHPMQGGILTFTGTRLAGLRPLEGGYRRFEVRPALSDSVYTVSYSYRCPYGLIEVEYRSGGTAGPGSLTLTVPVGCTAEAYLPRRGQPALHRTLRQGRHILNS